MQKSRVIYLMIFLLLPSLACALFDDILEPSATVAPPPTADGMAPTVTTAPGVDPSAAAATPTLAVTETPGSISLEELGAAPDNLSELREWLARAHDGAAPLGELCAALGAAQWQQTGDACEAADLDGDGTDEWLLTIDVTRLQEEPPPILPDGHPGDFWIVSEGQFVYQVHEDNEPDFLATAPRLVELVDMTGDDQPEAVISSTNCGAHTCFNYYQIIGAHDGAIRNLVQLSPEQLETGEALPGYISMPTVDAETIGDANDDGLPDLVIEGGLIGSAGAGIQRARTEIWAWSGDAIILDQTQWQETGYRFHWLYNANDAFEDQEYDLARARYEAVVVDPNLQDVEGMLGTAQEVRDHVRQFAAFRLSLLPLLRGDITESTRWRNWLQEEYALAPIAEAATRLFSEWESNGNNLATACAAVTSYLQSTTNPTGPLTDMGYNNPALAASDVCPIQ